MERGSDWLGSRRRSPTAKPRNSTTEEFRGGEDEDSRWRRVALKRLKSAQRGVIGPVGPSQRPVVVWQPKSMVTLLLTRVSHIAPALATISTGSSTTRAIH